MIVDTHCHLDHVKLAADEAGVVGRAVQNGVRLMVTIGTKRQHWQDVMALAGRHPSVVCALGIHPHYAAERGLDDPTELVELAAHPLVVGIGETGLDYYYDFAPREVQAASFRAHIEACRQTGLPLIVHTRDADEDTITILEDEAAKGPFTGVIHCFSTSRRMAERAVGLGLHLGIGGILTFKASDALRAIVADMPLSSLVLETDAPYLAPLPYRGKTNEPAYTALTAKALAELLGRPVGEIEAATTANARRLFPKAAALIDRPPCG